MNEIGLTTEFRRWQMRALAIGLLAAVVSIIGAIFDRAQFFHSYLFAWLFWSGLSLGALVILMMHALTGGKWGEAIHGLTTAAGATLPAMALLFLPVLFGLHEIYGWANGVFGESVHEHKAQYLTTPFFIARSLFYFVLLIGIGQLLRRWSQVPQKIGALSAGGLIVYMLCMNFASTDWVMSLDPQWYSTIFFVIFAAGQFLAALALATSLLAVLARHHSLGRSIPDEIFNDLGSLVLAFVIFWTYLAFSQFLIIWLGNLPREISWYLERSRGWWQWFAFVLFLGQFLLPFALLLSRAAKRNKQRLAIISLFILLANILNNFWLVAPSFHPDRFYVHWLDLALFVAIGGFWFALFFHFLKQRPLFAPGFLAND